jgi:hypothetical protein
LVLTHAGEQFEAVTGLGDAITVMLACFGADGVVGAFELSPQPEARSTAVTIARTVLMCCLPTIRAESVGVNYH